MTNKDCNTLKELNYLKNIEIDVSRIIKDTHHQEYTTNLIEHSYCPSDDIIKIKNDPFNLLSYHIKNSELSPIFIIGCTGVGKSSFLNYNKNILKKDCHVIMVNLDNEPDKDINIKIINKKFLDGLLAFIKNKFSKNGIFLKIIANSINNLPFVMSNINFKEDEYGTLSEEIDKKINNIRNDRTGKDVESLNIEILNNINIELKNINISNFKVVLAIDNIDRRDDKNYEARIVELGVFDLWEKYSEILIFKLIFSMRRVTFIRHIEGLERFGRHSIENISITMPDPIYLIANKILSPRRRDFSKSVPEELIVLDGKKFYGPTMAFKYIIYLVFILYNNHTSKFHDNLFIDAANENSRDFLKIIIDLSKLNFHDIENINSKFNSKSIDIIFDMVCSKVDLKSHIISLYNNDEDKYRIYNKEFIIITKNIINDNYNYKKLTMSNYYLISLLTRYSTVGYCRYQEGTKEDIVAAQFEKKYPPRYLNRFKFPMPFVNLFSPRYGSDYLLSRFMILNLIAKKQYRSEDLCNIDIGIPKEIIEDILLLFSQKNYLIGEDHETLEDTENHLILTRKGNSLLKLSSIPRYINIISKDSGLFSNKQLIPDHDIDNSIMMLEEFLLFEKKYFDNIYPEQKRAFENLIQSRARNNIPSFFSKQYFISLHSEIYNINRYLLTKSSSYSLASAEPVLDIAKEYLNYKIDINPMDFG